MSEKPDKRSSAWYDSRWGRIFYWGVLVLTLLGVVLSVIISGFVIRIPAVVYLFAFLGASVYALTSFARRFDQDDRYRLKILSRTIAVFPLAAGIYLLAFAFPGISGNASALDAGAHANQEVTRADQLLAGVIFLAGIYVSATLQALGGLADRLLGISPQRNENDS